VLAHAHASGVAEEAEVAAACDDAETSLRQVRAALEGERFGCGVEAARASLDAAMSKVESAERLVTDAWQRGDQRRAERSAAAELAREAIGRTGAAKDTAAALGLDALQAVVDATEAAETAAQTAALSVKQASSLPLAVVTEDARQAVEAAARLERVVGAQRSARDAFEAAERQRALWERAQAAKRAAATSTRQEEDQRQLRRVSTSSSFLCLLFSFVSHASTEQ